MHQRGFHLCIDSITTDDIRDFKLWMQEEYRYMEMYPVFYKDELPRDVAQQRSENSMSVHSTASAPSSNGASNASSQGTIL